MELPPNDKALKKAALKQLQKYGDSLLGVKKRPKKKQKRGIPADFKNGTNSPDSKKKKKDEKVKQLEEDQNSDESSVDYMDCHGESGERKETLTGTQRHLLELKQKMGLTDGEIARLKALKEANMPKSKYGKKPVSLGQKDRPPPEIVVFEDPARRKERKKEDLKPQPKVRDLPEPNSSKFHLPTARHDILQFGIKGSDPQKRQEAQVALAIKLGAKPPPKKCINYKEYQDIRKRELEEERGKRELDRQLGYKVSNPNKQIRARRRPGRDFIDGQVGQYKRGVQVLSSDDIDKVKKVKVRKL